MPPSDLRPRRPSLLRGGDAVADRGGLEPCSTGCCVRSEDGGNDRYGIRASDVPFPGSGAGPVHQTTSATNLATPWTVQTVALRRDPGTPSAALSWTPTSSSWASGYRLERSAGGAVQSTRTVTSAGTSSATEGPLVNGVTYTFRLWAYRGAWVSPDVTTTLTPSC